MAKKTNETKLSTKQLLALALVGAISEEVVAQVYVKLAQSIKRQQDIEISQQFNFYTSVFYEGVLLKSRTLNSQGQNTNIMEFEESHRAFYKKNKQKEEFPVYRFTERVGKINTTLLQIGYLTIIVSDTNKVAVQVYSAVLAMMYTLIKAAGLIKEWGHFHDLKTYFQEKDEIIFDLITQAEKVMAGKLGGHK